MIQRVEIQGYKSLRDVTIHLQPLTVIFGPNAAGKSNLFDVLALLSRIVQGQPLNLAFEGHRGDPAESFYYGDESLSTLLKRPHVEFRIKVDVSLDRTGKDEGLQDQITARHLRYGICVQMRPQTGRLAVTEESLIAIDQDGKPLGVEPFISTVQNRISARPEGTNSQAMTVPGGEDRALAGLALYPPAYPHLAAFQADVSTWQFHYLEPKRMMREDATLKHVTVLDSYGADLAAYYYALKEQTPRQFDAVNRALSSLLPRLTVDVQATGEGRLELKIREGRATFSVRTVSEGTLRLLGVLAALNPLPYVSTVGLEEPENGVHPRRLAWIAEMARNAVQMRDMQLLLTTHSPTLPGLFDESSLLICHKDGPETVFEPFVPRYDLRPVQVGEDERETTFTERVLRGDFGG
jgi:predicted ATPase